MTRHQLPKDRVYLPADLEDEIWHALKTLACFSSVRDLCATVEDVHGMSWYVELEDNPNGHMGIYEKFKVGMKASL